jgi:alkanesulfonate monooxygenase SsuD/methylene tetrahydromethanopterin reductase-like flavin-dependent oxidoreductase (luciferase family)
MRLSYAEALCDPTHYLPLARAVEDAGRDKFIAPDSICYPEVSDSKYPYAPDGNRELLEDKPFIEPFALIPAMGAVTSRLRFTTFVLRLSIRQPALVAKSAMSVAVMRQGRFGFGVGLSPWPEDFVVTGCCTPISHPGRVFRYPDRRNR